MAMNKKEKQALEDAQHERDLLKAFHWTDAPNPISAEDARKMSKVWRRWGETCRVIDGTDMSRNLMGLEEFHASESACLRAARVAIERECALKLLTIDRRLAALSGKGRG